MGFIFKSVIKALILKVIIGITAIQGRIFSTGSKLVCTDHQMGERTTLPMLLSLGYFIYSPLAFLLETRSRLNTKGFVSLEEFIHCKLSKSRNKFRKENDTYQQRILNDVGAL